MLTALRPRTTTELVDAAFALLRQNYRTLVTAGAVVMTPLLLLDMLVPIEAMPFAKLAGNFLYTLFDAAVILIISEGYLGRTTDVRATLQAVGSRAGSLFGAAFFRGLVVMLGMLLLVVPGIIFFAWSFAMPMAVIIEGEDASGAWKRSKALVKGSTGRVLMTVVLSFFVTMILIAFVGGMLGAMFSLVGAGARLSTLIGDVAMIFVYPAVSVIATLLYYDLRIRKEGFDLDMMAHELDPAGVPAPVPAI